MLEVDSLKNSLKTKLRYCANANDTAERKLSTYKERCQKYSGYFCRLSSSGRSVIPTDAGQEESSKEQ